MDALRLVTDQFGISDNRVSLNNVLVLVSFGEKDMKNVARAKQQNRLMETVKMEHCTILLSAPQQNLHRYSLS